MLINGSVGFVMIVTILYCLGDVKSVLDSPTGFPFIQIFQNSVEDIAGATVMTAVVLCLTWACSIGITTTASRMCWSFAHDRGLPFAKILERVDPKTKIPVAAVLVVTGIAALLTLIYLGSTTAFNDVISLTITGFYGSYFLPAAFLLYRRVKGEISPHGSNIDALDHDNSPNSLPDDTHKLPRESNDSDNGGIAVARVRLVWGPWHVPGILGIANNLYACCYMNFVIFWSVWPPSTPVSASTMNYSVMVTGGVMILSAIWYYVGGKKLYKGPLIDDEVAAVMRTGSVVSVH